MSQKPITMENFRKAAKLSCIDLTIFSPSERDIILEKLNNSYKIVQKLDEIDTTINDINNYDNSHLDLMSEHDFHSEPNLYPPLRSHIDTYSTFERQIDTPIEHHNILENASISSGRFFAVEKPKMFDQEFEE